MKQKYYYCADGETVKGPATKGDLRLLLKHKTLTYETQVCAENDATWKPISAVTKKRWWLRMLAVIFSGAFLLLVLLFFSPILMYQCSRAYSHSTQSKINTMPNNLQEAFSNDSTIFKLLENTYSRYYYFPEKDFDEERVELCSESMEIDAAMSMQIKIYNHASKLSKPYFYSIEISSYSPFRRFSGDGFLTIKADKKTIIQKSSKGYEHYLKQNVEPDGEICYEYYCQTTGRSYEEKIVFRIFASQLEALAGAQRIACQIKGYEPEIQKIQPQIKLFYDATQTLPK